jgi:hypothetical protein
MCIASSVDTKSGERFRRIASRLSWKLDAVERQGRKEGRKEGAIQVERRKDVHGNHLHVSALQVSVQLALISLDNADILGFETELAAT